MQAQSVIENVERGTGVLSSSKWANHTVFTVVEAAEILRISKLTLYEIIKRDELPVIRLGKQMRVARRTLANMLGE